MAKCADKSLNFVIWRFLLSIFRSACTDCFVARCVPTFFHCLKRRRIDETCMAIWTNVSTHINRNNTSVNIRCSTYHINFCPPPCFSIYLYGFLYPFQCLPVHVRPLSVFACVVLLFRRVACVCIPSRSEPWPDESLTCNGSIHFAFLCVSARSLFELKRETVHACHCGVCLRLWCELKRETVLSLVLRTVAPCCLHRRLMWVCLVFMAVLVSIPRVSIYFAVPLSVAASTCF